MRSIVVQLGAKHLPDEVQVALVDTKEVDFMGQVGSADRLDW
jgi:hypothetical protein